MQIARRMRGCDPPVSFGRRKKAKSHQAKNYDRASREISIYVWPKCADLKSFTRGASVNTRNDSKS
jgi:hypothetical protein